jgi:hypothetical protein
MLKNHRLLKILNIVEEMVQVYFNLHNKTTRNSFLAGKLGSHQTEIKILLVQEGTQF